MAIAKAEALQGPVIERFRQAGLNAVRLPDDILRALERPADEVMAEEAAKDPMFARVYGSTTSIQAAQEPWKELGCLPRDR